MSSELTIGRPASIRWPTILNPFDGIISCETFETFEGNGFSSFFQKFPSLHELKIQYVTRLGNHNVNNTASGFLNDSKRLQLRKHIIKEHEHTVSVRPVLRQLGCPQRIDKTHAESPNGLLQDSDSVEDTSVLEVAPLSIIRQTLYCETREKGSAAILTPDSFFGWGTSRQRHKQYKKVSEWNHLLVFQQKSAPPYISTKFSRLGPWLSANNTDRRTAEPFSHTLTHCHLFFLFFWTPDSDRCDGSFGW